MGSYLKVNLHEVASTLTDCHAAQFIIDVPYMSYICPMYSYSCIYAFIIHVSHNTCPIYVLYMSHICPIHVPYRRNAKGVSCRSIFWIRLDSTRMRCTHVCARAHTHTHTHAQEHARTHTNTNTLTCSHEALDTHTFCMHILCMHMHTRTMTRIHAHNV